MQIARKGDSSAGTISVLNRVLSNTNQTKAISTAKVMANLFFSNTTYAKEIQSYYNYLKASTSSALKKASRFLFHTEAKQNLKSTIEKIKSLQNVFGTISSDF
jgi:hypothetical protein